jgi:alcohol dehydrogenase class IV
LLIAVSAVNDFQSRTRIVIGLGCVRERLAAELHGLGAAVVAVIADRGFAHAGLLEPLLEQLEAPALTVCALIGVDPDVAEAEQAAQAASSAGADAVLTIGGGSALCAGKAVAIRLRNPGPLDAYRGRDRLPSRPAPMIAIPTTAGSGSEVSTVVVLHDAGREQHLVIRGRGYEPDVAMLDGTLLRSLPPRAMIDAALDALSHCYESLWSRKATLITDSLALSAARTIRSALPDALEHSDSAMQRLIVASAMGNLACGNAELGLVHALSSAVGVRLAHGYQNGVLLAHAVEFNLPVLDQEAAREVACLSGFYERIGFAPRFAAGEVSAADDLRGVLVAAGAEVR